MSSMDAFEVADANAVHAGSETDANRSGYRLTGTNSVPSLVGPTPGPVARAAGPLASRR